ncbi:TetR/AcrR family transcriptional regulator [Zhongshania sp.]|uniref:TetR/AcrR family transcriptional regulator n=1 Tax=Zhongshania sp. TaxID=1971902 RepID=UPI0025DFE671|nr:TetR/AcrR family transcriptional regulator [Zhongshania sp.]
MRQPRLVLCLSLRYYRNPNRGLEVNILPVVQLGRRERKKKAVRENICEQTLHLISRYGVDGITIDAICDCVDIAKKTFYNYYGSKHDLLVDICQSELLQRTDDLITEAIAQSDELAVQLDFILSVLATRNSTASKLERELIGYLVGSLSTNMSQGAGQLQFMSNCYHRLFNHSKEQLKAGLSPQFCAEMTVGMTNVITLNWLHDDHYDTSARFQSLQRFLKDSMLK